MLPQLLQSLGQHHFHSDQQKHPGVEWCMSSCPSSATSGSACGIASLEAACTGAHGNLSRQLLHMLASNSMHHLCRHLRVSLFGNGLVLRNSVGIFYYSRTLQGRWSTSVLASFYFFQSCILSFAGRLFMLGQPTLKCTRSSHPPSPNHHPRSFECTCLRRLCRRWSFFCCPSLFLSGPSQTSISTGNYASAAVAIPWATSFPQRPTKTSRCRMAHEQLPVLRDFWVSLRYCITRSCLHRRPWQLKHAASTHACEQQHASPV